MFRLGMLTSGGDCQALNAAMRGVVKTLCEKRDDVEIYGFQDGYKGLIYSNFKMLTKDFSGILTMGGTILGTSRQPFKLMRVPDENGLDKVEAMKHTYHKLNLDCLVILGGNGTHKSANMLREEGLNVVTLPKTIDNWFPECGRHCDGYNRPDPYDCNIPQPCIYRGSYGTQGRLGDTSCGYCRRSGYYSASGDPL